MVLVAVLGPTLVGQERLAPLRSRVLAALVGLRESGATIGALRDLAWDDEPPATARASLQNQIAALRRVLGNDAIAWDGERYRLASAVRTDLDDLEDALASIAAARADDDPQTVLEVCAAALDRFRGPPFADLHRARARALPASVRATALRGRLEETHADALAAVGRTAEAETAWRQLVTEQPLHEGRWAGLVSALDAAGRRADALHAYRDARTTLRDRLGLEPGPVLQSAHDAVLRGSRDPSADRDDDTIARPALVEEVLTSLEEHAVVVLIGAAGAGKTTTLRQLRDPRDRGQTLHLDCGGSPWTALEPVHDLLEAIGAAPVTARTTPQGDLPGQVAAAVAAAADERPLLVTVDHATAAGPTTWRALAAAARASTGLRLVLACRTAERVPPPFAEAHVVDVPSFDQGEVRQLVEALLDGSGRVEELATWLTQRTGGNPLFVRELVQDLRRRGMLRADDDGMVRPPEQMPAPVRLQSIVGQRLDALGLRARRTCDVLAVVAPVEHDGLLDALDVTPADLSLLRDAHVLAPGPDVAFQHAALQEVALELTPPGRRVEIAIAAAEHLAAAGAPPAAVARLRLEAAEVAPYAAAAACRDAARAVAAEQAFGEAVEWADRGLSVLTADVDDPGPLPTELAVLAADAARLGGLPGHAARLLTATEASLERSEPHLRRSAALALLRLGECCQPGEEQQRAVALGQRALALEDDPDHAARLHASMSLTHSMVDPGATRHHIDQALQRLAANDDDALAADVLPYTYMSLGLPAELRDRDRAAARLARAAAALGDPVAAYEADHLAFSVALMHGTRRELESAHDRMEAARHVVADAGRRWSLHYQRSTLAQLALDIDTAQEHALAARDIGERVAVGRAWATWSAQQLELHRIARSLPDLAPVVLPLVDAAGALPAWRAAAALVLAEIEPHRARDVLPDAVDELLAGPADFSTTAALQTAARAAVLLDDTDRAVELLPQLRPWTDRWSWQGTTTYGPLGDVVAGLGRLLADDDAVDDGVAGARAARERLEARDYP